MDSLIVIVLIDQSYLRGIFSTADFCMSWFLQLIFYFPNAEFTHLYSALQKIGHVVLNIWFRLSSLFHRLVNLQYVCAFNSRIYRLPGQLNLIILPTLMIKDVPFH